MFGKTGQKMDINFLFLCSFSTFCLFPTFSDFRQRSSNHEPLKTELSRKLFRVLPVTESKTKMLSVISAKKHSRISAIHVGSFMTTLKNRMRCFLIILYGQKVPKQFFSHQNGVKLQWSNLEKSAFDCDSSVNAWC